MINFCSGCGGESCVCHIKKLYSSAYDAVSRPAHYASGKIETIDVIEDWNLNYHRGNAVKYISRAGKKDPTKEIEDLSKAVWYLQREIKRLKNE